MSLITSTSTVSKKGQLVMPREIRQALKVKRGDRLSWTVDDAGELRVSVAKCGLMALQGRRPSRGRAVSVEDMDRAIKDGATEAE